LIAARLSNLPFKLESSIARAGMKAFGLRPSSSPYISGDSFRALADLIFEGGVLTRVRPGPGIRIAPLVFVSSGELKDYFRGNVGHSIGRRYVLISGNGDENIDESHLGLLDETVIHLFAQNLMVRHARATCIPIGLENARFHCNGIVSDFEGLRKELARVKKEPMILSGFTVGNNPEERTAAKSALSLSRAAREMDRTNSRSYRRQLARYMFVASPPGHGFDCHRTWEALYLRVVPVVRRHSFFEQFPHLPLLQVAEWKDLEQYSPERLAEEYESRRSCFDHLAMIWMDHWNTMIESSRRLVA
jgi:hypothetical protein